MITEELKKLYIAHTGHEPEAIDELPSSGSNRRYFRLTGTPTLIGVSGESVEENRAFLYMAEHFRQKGLPVPQVFIRSEDDVYYLQEDLGDTLLFNAIEKGRKTSVFGEEEKQLLRKTIRLLPAVQFAGAAGMDVRADIRESIVLGPLERTLVPTGLYVEIPDGYEIQVRPRSGLAARHGISLVNSPGTIDPDYRGEIKAILVNLSDEPFEIKPGERIAQLVVARFERAEWESVETLGETARGEGGMGSTGRG